MKEMLCALRRGSAAGVCACLLAVAAGCGGGAAAPAAMPDAPSGGFAVSLTNTAGEALAAADRIAVSVTPEGTEVRLAVTLEAGAAIGPDLFAEVTCPPGWHASRFEAGSAYGGAGRWISLAMLEERPARVGICLVGEHRNRPPAGGELFNLVFAPGVPARVRTVSRPPVSEYNVLHAADLAVSVNGLEVTFDWREKNRGDYDRDGLVAINDLTPIAVHFGQTLAEDADSVDLVDGSGNGRVGIEDITPIAVNFGGRIEGYRIWRSDLAPGQYLSNLQDPAHPEVSASRPDPATAPPGRLQYSYTDTAPDDTVTYVFYPYGDGEVGVASDEISPFSASGDATPPVWDADTGIITAELQAGPQILFTFGKATDADSPPVRYVLYWQEGPGPMDFGSANSKVFPVAEGEIVPYVRLLQSSDGVQPDTMYSLCVRARDNVGNETTNTNYLTVGGGSPDDFTPPEWTGQAGITSAVPGDGQVSVTWGEATDADSPPVTYLLWYAEAATGIDWGSAPEATYPAGTLGATVSGLINGVEYEFGVRARDSSANLNLTTNTNTLTATPTAGSSMPWGTPPLGMHEFLEIPVNDVAIVADAAGHPLIISVSKTEGGIQAHYYDEGASEWVHHEIAAGGTRYYHPDAVIVGSAVYVCAFDGVLGKLMLFTGNATADIWAPEEVDSPFENCYAASIDYSPVTNEIGIAAVFGEDDPPGPEEPPNEELWYYSKLLTGLEWAKELVDNSEPNIAYANMNMHPVTGAPAIAYGRGEVKYDIADPVNEAVIAFAEYDTGLQEWIIANLPDNRYTQSVDFAFDPANNEPVIAFSESVEVDFGGQPVPVTNASILTRVEGSWYYNLLASGDAYYSGYDIFQDLMGNDPDIEFAPDGHPVAVSTFVQAVYNAMEETWTVNTVNQMAERVMGWTTPTNLTPVDYGSATPALACEAGLIQVAFNALGIRTDPEEFTHRNDYAEGYLAYYVE